MRNYLFASVTGALLCTLSPFVSAAEAPGRNTHVLLTAEQDRLQAKARRLVASDVVQREIGQSIAYLKANHGYLTDKDRTEIEPYVRDLAYCVALVVANSDPSRPHVLYNGFPGAQYGLVNPDNIYRFIPVSPAYRYRVTGRLGGAAHVSFELKDTAPFEGGRLGRNFATLSSEMLKSTPDGAFTIELGSEPANGRANYIQLVEGSSLLMIRDTMDDWGAAPMSLQVERVDGQPLPEADDTVLAERAAAGLAKALRLWIETPYKYNFNIPVNTLPTPRSTGSGGLQGQYNTGGHFSLAEDQALVITLNKGNARYLGFQLGSNLYVPFEYARHTSSLTDKQAKPNPDGSYTYVISLRDPGVANWLDPVGHRTGLMFIRWQGLERPLTASEAPIVKLVDVERLSQALPTGVPRISPAERQEQLHRRQRDIDLQRK
ncbi:hypothetical protein [Caenibius sp. WL]|uniref:hypothetical protein n=1 Tax=Caenibius sp. WL TaxID=2872646 RepID=UPI001C998551|nr:hypothetical protein [Caenibius sp. WL]QZP09530.1 hypothetical protein K5X80_07240 [Caenibius sp. WL]